MNYLTWFLTTNPLGWYYCFPHFTDYKTKAQRGLAICPNSHSSLKKEKVERWIFPLLDWKAFLHCSPQELISALSDLEGHFVYLSSTVLDSSFCSCLLPSLDCKLLWGRTHPAEIKAWSTTPSSRLESPWHVPRIWAKRFSFIHQVFRDAFLLCPRLCARC